MKLMGWLFIAGLQIFLFKVKGLEIFATSSHSFHQWLVSIINEHPSSLNWFYAAILFGEDSAIRQKPEVAAFMVLGIYHIIVVSGSHFVMLQKIIEKILVLFRAPFISLITGILLFLFTMANLWQAACLRAYLTWALRKFKNKFVSDFDLQIFATLLCILVQPMFIQSLSFQLSCAASMGVSVAESLNPKSKFLVPVLCVMLTAPLVFNIQPCLSWLIIPVNILALPIVEAIMLPFSLISFIFPFLKFLTEPVLNLLFKVLGEVARFQNPMICLPTEGGRQWGMVYIAALYFCWRLFLPFFLRAQFKKNQMQF